MNPFTYYLISLTLISSFHLVGMDITNISSARVKKNTLYKMDLRFLTDPKPTTFKASPAPTSKKPVTIAEVELMVDILNQVEQNAINQSTHGTITARRVKKPARLSKQHVVVEEVLKPIKVVDVKDNLAIFASEDESRYYVRCERCSIHKQHLLSGKDFSAAYKCYRLHLQKKHHLSKDEVLTETPYRKQYAV